MYLQNVKHECNIFKVVLVILNNLIIFFPGFFHLKHRIGPFTYFSAYVIIIRLKINFSICLEFSEKFVS